ncbi:MAG: hypothetical protein AAF550_08590 [Myxococcota bacterium]
MTGKDSGNPETTELDALYEELQSKLQRDRGVRGWLRSRSIWKRLGLGIGLPILVAFGSDKFAGWSALTGVRMLGFVCLLTTSALFALWSMRPLHRPPPKLAEVWGMWLLALAVPIGLARSSGEADRHDALDSAFDQSALHCFVSGIFLTLPILGFWRLLDRTSLGNAQRTIVAATGAALATNAVLHLNCTLTGRGHLLSGHLTIVLAFLFLGFLYWNIAKWRQIEM